MQIMIFNKRYIKGSSAEQKIRELIKQNKLESLETQKKYKVKDLKSCITSLKKTLKQETQDLFRNFGEDRPIDRYEANRRTIVKLQRAKLDRSLIKLDLCIALKAVRGLIYLRAILLRIKTVKEIFILDISEGKEVYIPPSLSQNRLPKSFRFYDPIQNLIHQRTPGERVQFFNVQEQVAFSIHRQISLKQKLYEYIGIYESKNQKDQLVCEHPVLNERNFDFNHNSTHETRQLQRSDYIFIDHGIAQDDVLKQ